MSKKILVSGIKPTGEFHFGNYFGAMKQMVELQNSGNFDCLFMIADYHALNTVQNAEEMRSYNIDFVLDFNYDLGIRKGIS
jgi:tryptophanyl-tRNA synthetase